MKFKTMETKTLLIKAGKKSRYFSSRSCKKCLKKFKTHYLLKRHKVLYRRCDSRTVFRRKIPPPTTSKTKLLKDSGKGYVNVRLDDLEPLKKVNKDDINNRSDVIEYGKGKDFHLNNWSMENGCLESDITNDLNIRSEIAGLVKDSDLSNSNVQFEDHKKNGVTEESEIISNLRSNNKDGFNNTSELTEILQNDLREKSEVISILEDCNKSFLDVKAELTNCMNDDSKNGQPDVTGIFETFKDGNNNKDDISAQSMDTDHNDESGDIESLKYDFNKELKLVDSLNFCKKSEVVDILNHVNKSDINEELSVPDNNIENDNTESEVKETLNEAEKNDLCNKSEISKSFTDNSKFIINSSNNASCNERNSSTVREPFLCLICKRPFSNIRFLQKHVKVIHITKPKCGSFKTYHHFRKHKQARNKGFSRVASQRKNLTSKVLLNLIRKSKTKRIKQSLISNDLLDLQNNKTEENVTSNVPDSLEADANKNGVCGNQTDLITSLEVKELLTKEERYSAGYTPETETNELIINDMEVDTHKMSVTKADVQSCVVDSVDDELKDDIDKMTLKKPLYQNLLHNSESLKENEVVFLARRSKPFETLTKIKNNCSSQPIKLNRPERRNQSYLKNGDFRNGFFPSKHYCPICKKPLANNKSLHIHLSYVHFLEKKIDCIKCSKRFKVVRELRRHLCMKSDCSAKAVSQNEKEEKDDLQKGKDNENNTSTGVLQNEKEEKDDLQKGKDILQKESEVSTLSLGLRSRSRSVDSLKDVDSNLIKNRILMKRKCKNKIFQEQFRKIGLEPFQCQTCLKVFLTRRDFQRHKDRKTQCYWKEPVLSKLVDTVNVSLSLRRKSKSTDAIKEMDKSKVLKNEVLNKNIIRKPNSKIIQAHFNSVMLEKRFHCKRCLKRFKYHYELQRHKLRKTKCFNKFALHNEQNPVVVKEKFNNSESEKGKDIKKQSLSGISSSSVKSKIPVKKLSRESIDKLLTEDVKSKPQPHVCLICNTRFCSIFNLQKHLTYIHCLEPQFKCNRCLKVFRTTYDLGKHKLVKTKCNIQTAPQRKGNPSTPPLDNSKKTNLVPSRKSNRKVVSNHNECLLCTKSFSCRSELKTHVNIHYPQRSVKSQLFLSKYENKMKIGQSLNDSKIENDLLASNEPLFKCPKCGKLMSSKSGLLSHITYVHCLNPQYECKRCFKRFKTPYDLKRHELIKSSCISRTTIQRDAQKQNIALNLNKRSKLIKELKLKKGQEKETAANKTPFRCLLCKKYFSCLSAIKSHSQFHNSKGIKLHTKQKEPAGSASKKKLGLSSISSRVSKGARVFKTLCLKDNRKNKCPICKKVFSSKSNLTHHFRIIHEGRLRFECQNCHKKFRTKVVLLNHTNRGNCCFKDNIEEELVQANTALSFSKEKNRAHDKPSIKTSFASENLILNSTISALEVHRDKGPESSESNENYANACPFCSKEFVNKYTLNTHIYKFHEETKRHECKKCHSTFQTLWDLRQHSHINCCPKKSSDVSLVPPEVRYAPKLSGFVCVLCNAEFPNRDLLVSHASSIHRRRNAHECEKCHMVFWNKKDLMRRHKQCEGVVIPDNSPSIPSEKRVGLKTPKSEVRECRIILVRCDGFESFRDPESISREDLDTTPEMSVNQTIDPEINTNLDSARCLRKRSEATSPKPEPRSLRSRTNPNKRVTYESFDEEEEENLFLQLSKPEYQLSSFNLSGIPVNDTIETGLEKCQPVSLNESKIEQESPAAVFGRLQNQLNKKLKSVASKGSVDINEESKSNKLNDNPSSPTISELSEKFDVSCTVLKKEMYPGNSTENSFYTRFFRNRPKPGLDKSDTDDSALSDAQARTVSVISYASKANKELFSKEQESHNTSLLPKSPNNAKVHTDSGESNSITTHSSRTVKKKKKNLDSSQVRNPFTSDIQSPTTDKLVDGFSYEDIVLALSKNGLQLNSLLNDAGANELSAIKQKLGHWVKKDNNEIITKLNQDKDASTNVFLCQECGSTFQNRIAFAEHVLSHSTEKEKPYKCKLCTASFDKALSLQNHNTTHNVKAFQCPNCPRAFHRITHLNMHKCKKVSPLKCTKCNRKFMKISTRDAHFMNCHETPDVAKIKKNILQSLASSSRTEMFTPQRLNNSLMNNSKQEHNFPNSNFYPDISNFMKSGPTAKELSSPESLNYDVLCNLAKEGITDQRMLSILNPNIQKSNVAQEPYVELTGRESEKAGVETPFLWDPSINETENIFNYSVPTTEEFIDLFHEEVISRTVERSLKEGLSKVSDYDRDMMEGGLPSLVVNPAFEKAHINLGKPFLKESYLDNLKMNIPETPLKKPLLETDLVSNRMENEDNLSPTYRILDNTDFQTDVLSQKILLPGYNQSEESSQVPSHMEDVQSQSSNSPNVQSKSPNSGYVNVYACCGARYSTASDLRLHRETHHTKKGGKCDTCGLTFGNLQDLEFHRSEHKAATSTSFACPHCAVKLPKQDYKKGHMCPYRLQRLFKCPECSKIFKNKDVLKHHLSVQHKKDSVSSLVKKKKKQKLLKASGNVEEPKLHEKEHESVT